jgi:hypothetical protein
MTSATFNRYAESATVESKTGRMSERHGGTNVGSNQQLTNSWAIEAAINLDNISLERRGKAKHRRSYKQYSMGVWRAYYLNQWRFFIKPKYKRKLQNVVNKLKTVFF